MATIPTQTVDFQPGNRWTISDGARDMEFSMQALIHAAVTAGHPQGWRRSVLSITGGRAELLMRTAALQSTIYEKDTPRGSWQRPISRLFPTDRFSQMDDSEKRGLTYHLGTTMSVAWARKALRIPWLMHLNVYEQQLNINLRPGRSRPDLVGLHPDGSWVVFEAKGRSSAPSAKAEEKAKKQSQRVTNIGGVAPVACFALFAYFYRDPQAIGNRKPSVVHLRIRDPHPGTDEEPIELPQLKKEKLFEWYYQPWIQLLNRSRSTDVGSGVSPSASQAKSDAITWREVEDLDFRVGIIGDLKYLLELEQYDNIPETIQRIAEKEGLAEQYPDWAGDGLVIEPGESWKKLWQEE